MTTYVIGDVHGCYRELKELLKLIRFNRIQDKIIFVGDLIGRGPNSLDVLNFVTDLGDASINILGNHEIKFLAITQDAYPNEITEDFKLLLKSPLLDDYIFWLSQSPLIYSDENLKFIVVHAGLPPTWDIKKTQKYINFFEEYLLKNGLSQTMKKLFLGQSLNWHDEMTPEEILQYTIFGLTQIKFCFNVTYNLPVYQLTFLLNHLASCCLS